MQTLPPVPLTDVTDPSISQLHLGDIVTLPDGRSLTCRSRVDLPVAVGSLAHFLVLGELEMLAGLGPSPSSPVLTYVPVSPMPAHVLTGRSVCEGATRYWAPHLPALAGAMGELLWRVVEVRGSVDPAVIVYRGEEVIVFVRTGQFEAHELPVLHLSRDLSTEDVEVVRHAAVVAPLPMPGYVPAAPRVPVPAS